MSTGQIIGYVICGLFVLVAIVSTIAAHEERKERRKQNIRVPRVTSWERTNRYYRSKS